MSENDPYANKKKEFTVEGIPHSDANSPEKVQEMPSDQGRPENLSDSQAKPKVNKPKTDTDTST
jgi:hypothetical protein